MWLEQYLAQADHLLKIGDLKQAEFRCAEVLGMRPDYPPALHLRGLIALQSGDLDKAIEQVQRACQAKTVPANYYSNLAEMLRQKGRLAEGEVMARKAIAVDERLLCAWNNLGIILQESGKLEESQQCFMRVLRKEPNNAQVHNNLGTTFKRLGLADRAEAHWKRALAIAPNFSTPASNLASLYTEWGETEKAVAYGQQAIGGKSVPVDAYLNLVAAESARSNFSRALQVLDRLPAVASGDPRILSYRAMVLRQCERLDEAMECIERAVAIAPNYAEGQFTYGTVLKALRRNGDAMAAFERAASLPGSMREQALIGRATILGEIGRGEEALAALDKIIEEYPSSASAFFYRADYVKFVAGDPVIPIMQSLLRTNNPHALSNKTALNFALGKAFLDIGDSATAFNYLNEGNRLKRSTYKYDSKATSVWMSNIAAATSHETIERFGPAGFKSNLPIFVIGMPRSGTTLIEQILASHRNIFGAGELKYINELVDKCGGMPAGLSRIEPGALAIIGREYVDHLKRMAGDKQHVVDKMPSNFLHAGFIHMILPDAKIIHVVRDPVDTCLSCYSKLFSGEQAFAYDLSELAQFYNDYQKLMDHWRQVLPRQNLLEVQYEDVVGDLEKQARRMVDFLALPWDEACLEFYRSDRPVRTSSLNQVRRQVYRTSIGKWRAHAANLQPLLNGLGVTVDC